MRQITTEAYNAFKNNVRFKKSNTEVIITDDSTVMELFGNKIAKKVNGEIFISNGGWNSVTTKERLSPFVNKIRKCKNSIILEEKMELTREWINLNELTSW